LNPALILQDAKRVGIAEVPTEIKWHGVVESFNDIDASQALGIYLCVGFPIKEKQV